MRKKYDWPALVREHAQSGLTQKAFCEKRGMAAAYFSQRRRKLLAQTGTAKSGPAPGSFLRAQPKLPATGHLELSLGRITLRFGRDTSPAYVAALVDALA